MHELSGEQRAVVNHDVQEHGRVLAGPGTGKSYAAVAMRRLLTNERPDLDVQMVTFTRAATQSLAQKLEEHGVDVPPPSTIHSLALSLLLRHEQIARVPFPLRIPDDYETNKIRKDLARRLREDGYDYQDKRLISTHIKNNLEPEMAARWEALDEDLVLLTDIQPELRAAYSRHWERHRAVLGYTLLAEIPYRAGHLLEDHHPNIGALDFLLVDEYQDLNHADIRFLEELSDRGVRILAIGDDHQSIYGFRMAAPEGIRQFPEEFETDRTYNLTQCFRCGERIVEAATTLVEATAGPGERPPLRPAADHEGSFFYARFDNHEEEAAGVAEMIRARLDEGVPPAEIAVLCRSSVSDWVELLGPELERRDIEFVSRGQLKETLSRKGFRYKIELLQISSQEEGLDSLAWWILLDIINGISSRFRDYIFEEADDANESFVEALFRLHPNYEGSPTVRSANKAREEVERIRTRATELRRAAADATLGENGWGGWVLEQFDRESFEDDEIRLLEDVGAFVGDTDDLRGFLGKIEPVGKDLASGADEVRIMSMTGSKGLTVDSVFVMGVEEGLVPWEGARDPDEERRLLYVAMTRPEHLCVLSFANRRRGRTARHGGGNARQSRGRSPLLQHLPIGEWRDGAEVVRLVRDGDGL